MLRSVLIGALALLSAAASAQIFECIDAKGNREYAKVCAPDTVKQREILKGSHGAGPGGAAPQKSIEEQGAEFRGRQLERDEDEAKAAKEKADAEAAERNCNEARGRLKALEDGQRIFRLDPDTGERSYIGDDERAAEIDKARQAAESWCKK